MRWPITLILAILLANSPLHAQVTAYTNKPAWVAAISGNFSTINFTGFPDGTMIANQYEDVGVTFVGFAQIFQTGAFVNDGWGLYGLNGQRFRFSTPQNWVSVDYPGAIRFQLLNNSVVIYTSPFYQPGGTGHFAGFISSIAFDEVYLDKGPPFPNHVFIDDLHWGAPIPAPGALGLFGLAALIDKRRRRRRLA